ncbi:MAG: hypothetical protein V9H26_20565 [Verrucomicrobiota bacterium]
MRHLARGLPFKVAEQHRVPVRLAQFAERSVELRSDVFPKGVWFGGEQFVHGGDLLFANPAAHIGADGLRGDVLRGAMQPTGQHRAIHELGGAAGEREEHALGHILCEVRVTNHAQRGGMDEIHMPTHQFGERRIGALLRVGAQQLGVSLIVHSPYSSRRRQNRTGNVASGILPDVEGGILPPGMVPELIGDS